MRKDHCTITPAVVRSTARAALEEALAWQPYGRKVTVAKLLDLLLLIAALGSSLYDVVRRFCFGFCHETARQAVHANLADDDLDGLTNGLLDGLFAFADRSWRQRRWDVAIDLHYGPYYGDPETPGVVGGPKKAGTNYFYAYATAVLIHRRRRYTVGLIPLRPGTKPHQVVEALLDQLQARGLRLRGVVLDKGFGGGDVLTLLQERGLSYAVPLQRIGKGDNRRNACWKLPVGTVTTLAWVTEESRQAVSTEVVVGRRKAGQVSVTAFWGWGAAQAEQRARLARRKCRDRFGIETSYRQLNQGKGQTTAKDVAYRLLLVGVALLLRQAWVWLTRRLAQARGAKLTAWMGELPLARLLEWLAQTLKRRYPEEQSIDLGQPLGPLPGVAKL